MHLPLASEIYDNVITLNTLEHVWRDAFVVRECFRVLKPGGTLLIFVPFLYRVHGSPSDYHRHTAFYWDELLTEIGFAPENIQVEPTAFGPFTAPLSMIEFNYPAWIRRFLRLVVLGWPMLATRLRLWLQPGRPVSIDDGHEYPLGYYIRARK